MVKDMFDSKKGPGGCECNPTVLPYIYGELGKIEQIEFEEHLADCELCALEMSAFSGLRLSIGELKRSDPQALTASTGNRVESPGSILAGIKDLISGTLGVRVLAGAAAAVLIVLLGVVVFTVLNDGDSPPAVAGSIDPSSNSRSEEPGDPAAEQVSDPAGLVADSVPDMVSAEEVDSGNRMTNNSSGPREDSVRHRPQRKIKTPPREQIAESQEPPRLSEAASEEIEDDSLRLTDLFADISED